jgi:hypothetical protein
LPKALNEGCLPDNADFLLRHVPDAHLQFRLTCPHGGLRDVAARTLRKLTVLPPGFWVEARHAGL